MKKIMYLVTLAILMTYLCLLACATTIKIAEATVSPDSEFSVDISISGNNGISGLDYSVSFDNDILTLTEVSDGGMFPMFTCTQPSEANENGLLKISAVIGTSNVTTNGVLASLTFTVSPDAPEGITLLEAEYDPTTSFVLDGYDMVDLDATLNNGAITISYGIKGDVNMDDVINARDASAILQYLVGYNVEINESLADVNGDGNVSIFDAAIVLQHVAGWDVGLGGDDEEDDIPIGPGPDDVCPDDLYDTPIVPTTDETVVTFTTGSTVATVDGVPATLDSAPVWKNSELYFPAHVVTAFDIAIAWDAATSTATFTKGDFELELTVGSSIAYINRIPVKMDTYAGIFEHRFMLPAMSLCDILGIEYELEYDEAYTVTMYIPDDISEHITLPSFTMELRIGSSTARVNGVLYTLDAPAILRDDVVFMPIRFLVENLGASVAWDGATSTAIITKDDTELRLTIGSTTYYVNGIAHTLASAPFIYNSRTYLPVRIVAETFGTECFYDGTTQTAVIYAF